MKMLVTKKDSEFFLEAAQSSLLSKVTMGGPHLFSRHSFLNHLVLSSFPPSRQRLWLSFFLNFRMFIASFLNNRISLNSNNRVIQAR